ncbi:type III secretion system (T3SS) inner membrane Yop/YscD-like protein [Phyllobacterium myrsinacearum]|uniref:SctD/MshK family protein n=1 Tax=Phyllobacterium myrsinacearum TaxID=28101 RepID=UPI001029CABD|nr:EscD/YscD/HrpQ family type III secretion system periplasmic domain-containing protein [Phyllobacterium myrsinacearum]RZS77390.1 type III secretion system (T3SS) inner membrane Yop/YscD-like protein [Phyllobacterium myrsinacearum]
MMLMKQIPGGTGELTLNVLDGVHRGVVVPISGDDCQIGSSTDCDLFLSDSSIEERHFSIRRAGAMVVIGAHNGAVVINNRTTLEIGKGMRTRLPVRISAGGVSMVLNGPAKMKPDLQSRLRPWRKFGLIGGCIALLAVSIALVQAGIAGNFDSRRAGFETTAALQVAPVSAAAGDPRQVLSQMLADNGLEALDVQWEGSRVHVGGAVDQGQMKKWTDVQYRFDSQYGSRNVVSSSVHEEAKRIQPKFKLQAVWFGEKPYAIAADGSRLYTGAALEDGWIIKEIGSDRLVVKRNAEEFTLTF